VRRDSAISTGTQPRAVRALIALLRAYVKSGVRGSTRVTRLVARHLASLRTMSVNVEGQTLYVDLRFLDTHRLFAGSPWATCPLEQNERAAMRRVVRSGDIAFDVGAHIGLHTVLLASLVGLAGRVVAVEPSCELRANLESTIRELGNTELHPVALSSRDTVDSILFTPADRSMASLVDWSGFRVNRLPCQERRLDSLELPRPDFVKCDVEGAELLVFEGGRRIFDHKDAPITMFEANVRTSRGFGFSISAARDFLEGLENPEYQCFEILDGGSLAPLRELNAVHSNVLAVPRSRLARIG
jgi:FkbM family methyltransferase